MIIRSVLLKLIFCSAATRSSFFDTVVWTPQRQFQSLHGTFSENLRDDHFFHKHFVPPVRAELLRSMNAFEAVDSIDEGKSIIRDMLKPAFDSNRVIVMNNRVFVRKKFFGSEERKKHIEMLASMAEVVKISNFITLFNSDARGKCYNFSNRLLPTMVVSKIQGYEQPGILVPNQYFGNLYNWSRDCRAYEEVRRQHHWSNRTNAVFWRGRIDFSGKCTKDTGNFIRLAMIRLSLLHSDIFDVKCHKECNTAAAKTCRTFPGFDTMLKATYANASGTSSDTHLERYDYAGWKYLLNMPGRTSGSYSRNLNHLWFMGSILLLYDSQMVEWYYPALRQGKTHLTVNETTALETFSAVSNDTKLQRLLLENARHVSSQLICPRCLARYMLETVRALRNHFRFDLTLDNATNARNALKPLIKGCGNYMEDPLLEVKTVKGSLETIEVQCESLPVMFGLLKRVKDDDYLT